MAKNREKELAKLKIDLLEQRAKAEDQLLLIRTTITSADHMTIEVSGDDADRASQLIEDRTGLKLQNRVKNLVNKIDHALAKFEDGTYGICEHSGEEIPIERLEVRPFTRYTVEAQTEIERNEKKFRQKKEPGDGGEDDGIEESED